MAHPITDAHMLKVLKATCRFIDEQGYSPTLKELSEATSYSESKVWRELDTLRKLQLVYREPGKRIRNLKVLQAGRNMVQ